MNIITDDNDDGVDDEPGEGGLKVTKENNKDPKIQRSKYPKNELG